jgi:hypothetical protein
VYPWSMGYSGQMLTVALPGERTPWEYALFVLTRSSTWSSTIRLLCPSTSGMSQTSSLADRIRRNMRRYLERTDLELSRSDRRIPMASGKESIQPNTIAEKSLFRVYSAGKSRFNFRIHVYLSIWACSLRFRRNFHIRYEMPILFVRGEPSGFNIAEIIGSNDLYMGPGDQDWGITAEAIGPAIRYHEFRIRHLIISYFLWLYFRFIY